MYYSFWIHSFADGHLGCFQYLAIVNCAAMNIGVRRFFWIGVSGFFVGEDMEKRNHSALLVGMQTGEGTVEKQYGISSEN